MKKWIGIIAVTGLLLLGIRVTTFGTSQNITTREVENLTSPENRQRIGQNVLQDTGLTDRYNTSDIREIKVYPGNVDGEDGEDLIVSIAFGPTDTVVAAYKNTGDGFEYLGTVGTFFTIENITLVPTQTIGRDLIVINERANQKIGAFEDSSFVKGYIWKDNAFDEALRIPETIQTDWNRAWDSLDPNAPSQWERIQMSSDLAYEGPTNPAISSIQYQSHRTSRDTVSKMVPADDTYFTVQERIVRQRFYWAPDWQRYILFEAKENSTGERVAVIGDESASPYALLPEYDQYSNLYEIVRENGTREFVDRNLLTPIEDSASQAVYKSLP